MAIKFSSRLAGIVGVLLIIDVLAFGSYFLLEKQKISKGSDESSLLASAILAYDTCNLGDKELCSFLLSWRNRPSYHIDSVEAYEGYKAVTSVDVSGARRFHMTISGSLNYELVIVDTTIYVKDFRDGRWWQQVVPSAEVDFYKGDYVYGFDLQPTSKDIKKTIKYSRIATEKCAGVDCLKYEVVDPNNASGERQYMWFTKDSSQLGRVNLAHGDGSNSTHNISYRNVDINLPTETKPVDVGRIILPGGQTQSVLPGGQSLTDSIKRR